MTYGLPAGTNIPYGGQGFPQWVYDLVRSFNLHGASTYPGHQEGERAEAGYAPNPDGLNRGIDFAGSFPDMQRFAEYLLTVKGGLEQVIWENPDGRRIGVAGGDDVSHTAYYEADYAGHRDHVHLRVSQPIPLPQEIPMPDPRPDFNEYPLWSKNTQNRNGTNIDLFILHTQEGNGNADSLARWMNNNNVSYHYTVSMDPRDKGVTVVDVVDTDLASWSVLNANNRSINLCFAGSFAGWSRAKWMDNSRAIDVAAYLAVQDCKKYGIPMTVIAPPYNTAKAGITDHAYVTKVLGVGTHTDVGPNFPWDYFTSRVSYWANPTPPPPPVKPVTLEDIKTQLDRIEKMLTK